MAAAEGRNTLSPAYATHKSCLTCASCTQKIIASTRCDRSNDLVELSVDFVALLLLDQLLASLSLSLACSLSFSHPSVSTLKRGLYHICPSTDFPTVIAIIFGPAQCAICITFCPLHFATFGCAWVGSERGIGVGGSNCAESARGELVIQSACIQTCNSNFKTIFNLLTEQLPDWLGPAAASVAAPTAAATPA